MTLEQLRIFVAVAERQHVTAAAQAIGLTQSAASAAIAALEQRYATKLFHRIGRGIRLTEAGSRFLVDAREVLARAAAAEQVLEDLSGLKRGTLRVHASQTVGGYWLPRHLLAFRTEHPGITLALRIGNTAEVAQAVLEGTAEVGFIEAPVSQPLLVPEVIAHDRLMIVVGRQHAWAGRARVGADELARARWVLRERGSGTRAMFESALRAAGIDLGRLDVVAEFPSNEAVRAAVVEGSAASALSASVVDAELRSGVLCSPRFDLPDRPFFSLIHRDRYLSHSAGALVARIRAVARAG